MSVCRTVQEEISKRLLLWISLCTYLKIDSFASSVKAMFPNNRVCNVGWQNCDISYNISILIALYFRHFNRKCLLVSGSPHVHLGSSMIFLWYR